jgi:hypothetical protein
MDMKLKKLLLAGLVASASIVAIAPASAATLDVSSGFANFAGSRTTTGTFQDVFTFDLTGKNFGSGSISTRLLRNMNGAVISDLDFLSVLLNGTAFTLDESNSDAAEARFLSSSPLLNGLNTLTVNYKIDTARGGTRVGYAGTLNVTPAVPEPASWALMIGGFGLVGGTMRRRSVKTKVAFA